GGGGGGAGAGAWGSGGRRVAGGGGRRQDGGMPSVLVELGLAELGHRELPPDPAATERLGEALGRRLRPGDAVALVGELGAGKTALARGLGRGLGVDDAEAIASPTYLVVVEHAGPVRMLHADAYLPQKLAAFLQD